MIGDGDCGEIGGMEIDRENPKYSEKTCPSANVVNHKSHMNRSRFVPGPPRWEASD
jgi:hypothetical protein